LSPAVPSRSPIPQSRPAVPSRSPVPQSRPAVPSRSPVPQSRPAVPPHSPVPQSRPTVPSHGPASSGVGSPILWVTYLSKKCDPTRPPDESVPSHRVLVCLRPVAKRWQDLPPFPNEVVPSQIAKASGPTPVQFLTTPSTVFPHAQCKPPLLKRCPERGTSPAFAWCGSIDFTIKNTANRSRVSMRVETTSQILCPERRDSQRNRVRFRPAPFDRGAPTRSARLARVRRVIRRPESRRESNGSQSPCRPTSIRP
jgi:hypothetical protein